MRGHLGNGPVARTITFLSMRGFTAFDALMIPFHILFAAIMFATAPAAIQASPVYSKCAQVAPIDVWAAILAFLAVVIVTGIAKRWWYLARLSYVLIAAWWFAICGLVYLAATTLLSPAVYLLIGIVCLYRQAEIAVSHEHGSE